MQHEVLLFFFFLFFCFFCFFFFSSFSWWHIEYKGWMCERLLNLQEIYVSGQNICIEVYGNSVGTITPPTLPYIHFNCRTTPVLSTRRGYKWKETQTLFTTEQPHQPSAITKDEVSVKYRHLCLTTFNCKNIQTCGPIFEDWRHCFGARTLAFQMSTTAIKWK